MNDQENPKFAMQLNEEFLGAVSAFTGGDAPDFLDLYILIEVTGPMEFKGMLVSKDYLYDEDGHGKENIMFLFQEQE